MKNSFGKHTVRIKVSAFVFALIIAATIVLFACGCGKNAQVPTESVTPPSAIVKPEEPQTQGTEEPQTGTPSVGEAESPQTQGTPAVQEPLPETPPETPPATQSKDMLLKVTASALNVRSGAGTSYKVIGAVKKGDRLAPVSLSGGWYKVLYRDGFGYVSASYVETDYLDKSAERKTESVIEEGKKLLGTLYVYGAQRYHFGGKLNSAFKKSEFDCSSLMQYIFKIGANIDLSTTSRSQSLEGKAVKRADIRRGDLLFFTNDSRYGNSGLERIGHVGLYLGNDLILHTASDYAVIEEISPKRWSYFITARRVL